MNACLRIFAERQFCSDTVGIYLKRIFPGQRPDECPPLIASPISFYQHPVDGVRIPPAIELRPDEAQQLMDALWNCGLRPTEGSGSAGSLAATQFHLEDMRSLVFKTPKPPTPKR